MTAKLSKEDKILIDRLSKIENPKSHKAIHSKLLERKLGYKFYKIDYTFERMYKHNKTTLQIKHFPIITRKNHRQNKYYFYLRDRKDFIEWAVEELEKDHGETDFIPDNWKSTSLLSNIYGVSNNRVYTEMKKLYENKDSWDAEKEGFEFPIRKGEKLKKRGQPHIKGYFLNPDVKIVNWFNKKVNSSIKIKRQPKKK